MKEKTQHKERFFSLELESKANLKTVTLTDSDSALIEGTIGGLVQASFVEGEILEIVGKTGTFRINLREEELKKPLPTSASAKAPNQKKKEQGEVK